MREGELWAEVQSERTHGNHQARLASERKAFAIRTFFRDEFKYPHDVRWFECADIEQERAGRSCVRAVDWQHVSDQRECCELVPYCSEPAGNSKNNGSFRHLAGIGRECSLQSGHGTSHYGS